MSVSNTSRPKPGSAEAIELWSAEVDEIIESSGIEINVAMLDSLFPEPESDDSRIMFGGYIEVEAELWETTERVDPETVSRISGVHATDIPEPISQYTLELINSYGTLVPYEPIPLPPVSESDYTAPHYSMGAGNNSQFHVNGSLIRANVTPSEIIETLRENSLTEPRHCIDGRPEASFRSQEEHLPLIGESRGGRIARLLGSVAVYSLMHDRSPENE